MPPRRILAIKAINAWNRFKRSRLAATVRMDSTLLVTGGAGFIGSHLVHDLVAAGARVRVLEHPRAAVDHLPLHRVDLVRADITQRDQVRQAVRGCSEVFHLAANPNLWAQKRGSFFRVNHLGTVHVLEEALDAGARRILHCSTESILTRARQQGAIGHEQHITLDDVIGPYCRSKLRAERHALGLARAGAPIVVVCPTLPVGPGDRGQSPPTRMILDFCRGKRKEYVDAALNLIDVRDVAHGMVLAMAHGQPGRRYLLGHENLSIREVFRLLAGLTGLPEPTRRVPYAVALAAAYVNEWWADVVSHEMPVATVTGVKLTRRVMHFDAAPSLRALGLTPRPVTQSLNDALAWFRAQGWL